jgi:hypothetical protein
MPFGLKNAGMTFQRLMDRIFFDIPFVYVYLDDMLITSRSLGDHRRHLEEVLRRLQANGLVIKAGKCVWAQQAVEFLGHNILAKGLSPLPHRVEAVSNFPQPRTVKQLQAFLGLFNFHRRFVPAAATIVRPLTDALRGNPRQRQASQWVGGNESSLCGHQGGASHCRAVGPPGGGGRAGRGDRYLRITFGRCPSAEAAGQLVAAAGFLFQEAV